MEKIGLVACIVVAVFFGFILGNGSTEPLVGLFRTIDQVGTVYADNVRYYRAKKHADEVLRKAEVAGIEHGMDAEALASVYAIEAGLNPVGLPARHPGCVQVGNRWRCE